MFQDEDGDDDDDEEIPLDMEEVEAASKKARQDEDIHSEHVQVNDKTLNQRNSKHVQVKIGRSMFSIFLVLALLK